MNEALVTEAKKYLGQHEISGNQGFVNAAFETEMKEEGWQKGWAWCAVFIRLVVVNVYVERVKEFRKLITPSVMQTYRNLRDAYFLIGYLPQVGAIVVYQSYKDGKPLETGHIGIVTAVRPDGTYDDISGNTSETGTMSREGVVVGIKSHRLDMKINNGLRPIAFIQLS